MKLFRFVPAAVHDEQRRTLSPTVANNVTSKIAVGAGAPNKQTGFDRGHISDREKA